jgi:hypothetical protein
MAPSQSVPISILGPILAEWANTHSPRVPPRNASPNQFFRFDQPGRSPRPRRRFPSRSRFDRGSKGGGK